MRKVTFGKPIIGDEERNAVQKVLEGTLLVHGPIAKQFEADFASYTGSEACVSVSSCTAGLHLCYFDMGLGAGDEVIVPAQTHVATAHAVELCGAKPVFVDAEIKSGNIDISKIEERITPRTKAISVVHFLGLPVAMDKVCAIAEKHGLKVIEDCALAIGGRYKGKHVGLWGDAGAYSFYPVKHITTAEGGVVITKHEDLAARLVHKKAFGVDRNVTERKEPGIYDVTDLGFNYRMNEMQAAIGIEQMKRIDGFLEKRKANYDTLYAGLENIDGVTLFEKPGADFENSHYCLSIILDEKMRADRSKLVKAINDKGVGTSVYYPSPVPYFTYYKEKYPVTGDEYPVASAISYGSIALPVGPHLGAEDMEYVAEMVKKSVGEVF
ncbi:DegT/DnrJ/EryC1/StrS aminotransferase family protein [Desulfovibrio sp. JC010]|uniref:DegT/DnrJ/EryC1/StrS family aminotransferase n=1 Tax=Desulfovibrio sp. JC010 TaxID=2593641 RepID=UPI0013D457C1|nr:DegT/DnrJ/EryC1/StrS family aminotransferase [Desulfovibrio sp. JC010]NDV27160.1 DegT/DnrJ/EryC1/StrS family aminotransferase [Desulfovibrio sp. JC010]